MKLSNRILLILLSAAVMACSCSHSGDSIIPEIENEVLNIGALLPLTGTGPVDGNAKKAVIELAVEDINRYFEDNSIAKEVAINLIDSENDPLIMSNAISDFETAGINIVLSATTSWELFVIEQVIADAQIVTVNTSSTAPSLAQDDMILRLIPDDTRTAESMALQLRSDGIEQLVILFRNDQWGTDLNTYLSEDFENLGGSVAYSRGFSAREVPESLTDEMDDLNSAVQLLLQTHTTDKIAVVAFTFNEGIDLLRNASEFSDLLSVSWYGSDGMTNNADIFSDSLATYAAAATGFYCPSIAELTTTRYQDILSRAEGNLGYTPYPLAMLMYDALFAAALTLHETGTDADAATVKAKFEDVVKNLDAVTGDIELNSNGDRINCGFDYWGIKEEGGEFIWYKAF